MFAFPKLILLILVIAAVWIGYRWLNGPPRRRRVAVRQRRVRLFMPKIWRLAALRRLCVGSRAGLRQTRLSATAMIGRVVEGRF